MWLRSLQRVRELLFDAFALSMLTLAIQPTKRHRKAVVLYARAIRNHRTIGETMIRRPPSFKTGIPA